MLDALIAVAILVLMSGWIAMELVARGRLSPRIGAYFIIGRIPVFVALLGLALGSSPVVAVAIAGLVGIGAVVGYWLMNAAGANS